MCYWKKRGAENVGEETISIIMYSSPIWNTIESLWRFFWKKFESIHCKYSLSSLVRTLKFSNENSFFVVLLSVKYLYKQVKIHVSVVHDSWQSEKKSRLELSTSLLMIYSVKIRGRLCIATHIINVAWKCKVHSEVWRWAVDWVRIYLKKSYIRQVPNNLLRE